MNDASLHSDATKEAGSGPTFVLWAVCCSAVLATVCSLAFFFNGRPGFEKSLTLMAMPVGASWLLVSGLALQYLLRRRVGAATPWLIAWLLITAITTSPLPDRAIRYLETQETAFDPTQDRPLDLLIVLGGGTRKGPNRPQAADAGDRVLYAAQLYLQRHARRLVTTGVAIDGPADDSLDPAAQTVEIWTQLNIPRDAIQVLTGINTYQELQSIRESLEGDAADRKGQLDSRQPTDTDRIEEADAPRIGLLTSAWHLPRAMRLARAQGLELIPVAADYLGEDASTRPFYDQLPSAQNVRRAEMAQKEFMAAVLRR